MVCVGLMAAGFPGRDVILEELLQSDIVTQQPLLAELYYEVCLAREGLAF